MAKLLSGTRIYGSATIDTTLSLGTSAIFTGSTSGTTTLLATAIAGTTTLTLPAATDTLVGRATTDTLTNKTLTFPVINNIREGYTSTATAAGTTTLTSSSNHYQRFTGSTTQTIVLPVTSTLATGVSYSIENASTGNLTVNSSGGNLVVTIIPGVTVQCMCIGTSLTTAADWDAEYTEFAAITGTGSNVLSVSPALTGTATFANATSASGFLAVGSAVTTNRIYATNGAAVASILGNNTFQTTSGLAGVSGTTTSAGNGHLGYFNGTVRAGVYGQIGSYDSNVTTYAGYFDGRVAVTGALIVTGDLTVNGTTTTVNSTTLTVDDKNIELGSTASPTDVTADGGGITLKGTTDKTFNWVDATDAWTSSEHLNLVSTKAYYIAGTSVLNATTLGSGVTGSSLTSVGTIATGVWNGTVVAGQYGGTGVANTGKTITLGGNLTTSGAYTTTFTSTANTSVTLPSTGTLATLDGTESLTNKTLTTPVVDRIDWAASGTGAPAFTTRSAGTKLTLYPAIGASSADYAIGINAATLWSSIPTNVSDHYFKWYGGTTEVASLSGTGVLTVGSINNPTITGTLTAGGSAGTTGYYLQTTGSGVQWAEVSSSSVIGYNNSTVSAFPSGDYNGADAYVGHSGSGTDAFGVSLLTIFTCMDPVGSLQTTDLGVLT